MRSLPYQPFVEALSEGVGLSVDDIVPSADEDPTGASRYRFFEQVARLVGDLTPPAPALVALDDLQWADVSTMQLIRHLARSHHAGGVLLVLSYRAGDVSAPLADLLMDLNRELPLERIVLGGLTEQDVASLLREWGSDAPDLEAQALHDRTDGNPFFIRELVRDRAEGRDPRQSVPQTVRDVVALRLARLEPARAGAARGRCGGRAGVRSRRCQRRPRRAVHRGRAGVARRPARRAAGSWTTPSAAPCSGSSTA